MPNPLRVDIIRRKIAALTALLFIWMVIILAMYGAIQWWDRSDRILQKQAYIHTINQQQQEIDKLRSGIKQNGKFM